MQRPAGGDPPDDGAAGRPMARWPRTPGVVTVTVAWGRADRDTFEIAVRR